MFRTVGYVRLSKEDYDLGKFDESESIVNQKKFIKDFVTEQGWILEKIYVDEDISGSDRDRPGFNEMILDAYAKKFDIIVVKKQSRFARDLELIEKYILNGFAEIGIRFISILDNIDTNNFSSGMRKASQINGLVDQWYLEDLSDSIKASFYAKAKRGESICSFAKYGYLKDPEKKGHLIVDAEAAGIVHRIFKMYSEGYGETKIANTLNSEGIPNPFAYKKRFTNIKLHNETEQSSYWRPGTISQMLVDETYIGSVVSHRYKKVSYKSKKLVLRPQEEWIIVPNCHEAIIDMALWEHVQRIKKDKSICSGTNGKRHPLAGKVLCSKCQGKMIRSGSDNGNAYFRCSKRAITKELCTGSSINLKQVENAIITQFNIITRKYVDSDYQLDNIPDKNIELVNYLDNEIDISKKRLSALKKKIQTLYQDRLNEIISLDEYINLKKQMDDETFELSEKIKYLEQEYLDVMNKSDVFDRKKEVLSKYLNVKLITQDIVDLFIEKVYIYDNGKKDKEIEVVWKI